MNQFPTMLKMTENQIAAYGRIINKIEKAESQGYATPVYGQCDNLEVLKLSKWKIGKLNIRRRQILDGVYTPKFLHEL